MEEQLNNTAVEPAVTPAAPATQEDTGISSVSPFASREIVPKTKVKKTDIEDENDPVMEEAEPLTQIGDESTDDKQDDSSGDFFQKSTSGEQGGSVHDQLQSADYYWENNQDLRNKFELEFPGKGREKYEQYYQDIADKYFKKTVSYTDDLILNSANMGEEYYRNGRRVITDSSTPGPIGGGYSVGGQVKGQNISVRQAEINSKNLLTDEGKLIKVDEEWSDVIGNPKYKNKNGKLITALEYIPVDPSDRTEGGLKAVYEGERSLGEVVSIHDMKGWVTSNIGMETPGLYVIPKAVARATVNTVASLASSSVDLLNSTANLLDSDNDNATIRATNDLRSKLKAYEITTSDYDQQNMLTFANGMNLIADVAAQLLLAGGVGKVASGLAKISQAAGGVAQKYGTLTALSLMGSSDIKDEALKAGFSEDQAAGLFLAYLPAMAAANSLSEIVIDGNSAPFIKAEMNRLARQELALQTPQSLDTDASKWAFAKSLVAKVENSIGKLSETMSQGTASKATELGHAALAEGTQEVVEQIMGDALKTGANVISKFSSPTEDYHKMVGMYDREYWEKAPTELLMNFVGGAIGGPMARLTMNHGGIQSLPFQTEDKDKILRLAMKGEPYISLYKESLVRARDKGLLGSDKYSYKLNADKKFTRLADLSEAEKANHISIAEANYRLKMMQLNTYQHMVGGFNGTYDKFVKEHPELSTQMTDRSAAYDRAAKTYKELETLYKEVSPENYQAASELKKSWFKKPILSNAAKDAATATAKENTKTTDGNAQVTTSEALSSPDIMPTVEFSDELKAYAQKLGIEPAKAKQILDKEQELDDMVSGKTLERDFIDMIIASDPVTFGALAGQTDTLFDAAGGDLIQKLTQADVRRFTDDQKNYANYITTKARFDAQVDSLSNREDLQKLVDDVADSGGNLIISPEKRALLKSKLETIVSSGFTQADSDALASIIEEDYNIAQTLGSTNIVMHGTDTEYSIQNKIHNAIESMDGDFEFGKETVFNIIDDNLPTLFNFAKASLIDDYIKMGPAGVFKLLNMKIGNDQEKFRQFLEASIMDSSAEEEITIPLIDAFQSYVQSEENAVPLISEDNELKKSILPYLDVLETAKKSASEETQTDAGDFIYTFLKQVSAKDGDLEVTPTSLPLAAAQLFTRMNPELETDDDLELLKKMLYREDGSESSVEGLRDMPVGEERQKLFKKFYGKALFDATDDARTLLASVKLRQAQINLLTRIGDPRSELKNQDGSTDVISQLFASLNQLASLKEHNSKVLTPEEFNDSVENTKYSKFSKVISGWLVDPMKLKSIYGKANLTPEEVIQKKEIQRRLTELLVVKGYLDQTEADLNTLIAIGESSMDAAAISNKFKGSIKEYIAGKGGKDKRSGLITRIDNLLQDIEAPQIKEKIAELLTLAPNVSPDNDDMIKHLYNKYVDLARSLYTLTAEQKAAVMDKIPTMDDLQNNADIVSFMSADVAVFYTHFKNAVSSVKDSGSLIIPSMEQELVALQAFTYATTPTKNNLIKQKTVSFKDAKPGMENMIFVPGSYGTGKTKVIAGYTAKTIQLFQRENYKGTSHKVILGANNSDQIENLATVSKDFKVILEDGQSGSGFSQEDFLFLFEDVDSAYDKLKNTSLMIFDEATMIEFYNKGSNPTPLLQMIYEGLADINERRVREGLPEITFIGMGDRYQGGWRSGASTVRGTTIPDTSEGVPYNIASGVSSVFRTSPLTTSFRSYVVTIDKFASAALNIGKSSLGRKIVNNNTDKIVTQHGRIIGDTTGKLGGVHVVNSTADLYDGMAAEIRKQLKENEGFKVLIVDDSLKSLENIDNEELRALIAEYPEAFRLENISGIADIRVRSMEAAQGSEANYVIVNTPDGWLPKISEAGTLGYRYNMISMLAGRARQFVRIRVDSTVNITSGSGPVQIPSIQQSTGDFMKEWSDLRLSILGEMPDVNTAPDTPQIFGSQETSFVAGEVIQKNLPDGTPVEEVIVKEVSEEGDVIVVSPETGIEEVAGNISDPNISVILQRPIISNTTKEEPDTEILNQAKDERLAAYDTYTRKTGTLGKYQGKPVKIIQFSKSNDYVTIRLDDGTEETLKVSESFGTELTVDRIEAKFVSDKQLSEVVSNPEPVKQISPEEAQELEDLIFQEDDPELDDEDIEFAEFMTKEEVFDSKTDTTEAKSVLSKLEKKGIGIGYVDTSKEEDKGLFSDSLRFRRHYSNDNFNTGAKIASEAELLDLLNRASGYVGKTKREREAEMGNFTYSFVTYEFYGKNKQKQMFANAIVAKEKSTGKKFILGMFSTSKLEDGDFKSFLTNRTDTLKNIIAAYRESSNGAEHKLTDYNESIPGSVVYEASNVRLKGDRYKDIVPDTMFKRNQVPLVLETDITDDFLSGDKILVGTTPGALVRSSKEISELMKTIDTASSWNSGTVGEFMTAAEFDKAGRQIKPTIEINIGKTTINDTSIDKSKRGFRSFGKNKVAKYKDYFIVMPSYNNDSIGLPFITKDGVEFSLLYGFTKNGEPITNELMAEDKEIVSTIPNAFKKALEEGGLDTSMKKVTEYKTDDDLKQLRREIANGLNYDLSKFDKAFSSVDKFNYAMSSLIKYTPTYLADLPISLTDLLTILKHPRNNRTNLSISSPMVLRQSDKGKKGLSQGRIFVLYSSNGRYDLTDPAVVKGLETELRAHMKNAQGDGIESAIGYLRNGVGIITLDYPHSSMQELAAIRRKSKTSKLNRYAIPSESVVGKRFIAMLAEIGDIIKDKKEDYTRLKELKKVNVHDGAVVSVIKKDTITPFLEALVEKAQLNDPAAIHFLTIIRTITRDSNLGNYVTTREAGSLEDMRKHKYPAERVPDVKYEFVPGATGKPRVFEINKNPLIFIPQSVATEIGYDGVSQPMRFNMEALLDLIENGDEKSISKPSIEVANNTLAIFDSLMQNHTIGLNKGIKVPPAMMKAGKSLWGVLSDTEDGTLSDKLTTPVKDIRSAALAFNLKNLIESVESASTKKTTRSSEVVTDSKLKEEVNKEFDAIVSDALDKLSSFSNVTEDIVKQAQKTALNNLAAAKDKWLASVAPKSPKATIINTLYASAYTKLTKAMTAKAVKTEYTMDDVRNNKFDRPDIVKLAQLAGKHGFEQAAVTDLLDRLTFVVDEAALRVIENEVKTTLSKISDKLDKKFLQNYFDPILSALNSSKDRINTLTSIEEVIALFEAKKLKISPLQTSTNDVINNLQSFNNIETFNPYQKTTLLQAYVHGTDEEKKALKPYLDSSTTDMKDPIIIAQSIYDAIVGGYPVNEQSKLVIELSKKNPQMLSALMANENVVNALAETTEQDWVSNFELEVSLVNQLDDINTKTQYLNALQAVIEGLRPVLSENVIKQMEQMLTEARTSLDLARSGGSGPDLLSQLESSPFFSELGKEAKQRYSTAIINSQKELGTKLAVIVDVLSGQRTIADPVVFEEFSESKALLMDSLYDQLGKADFKVVGPMLAKLFNSIC